MSLSVSAPVDVSYRKRSFDCKLKLELLKTTKMTSKRLTKFCWFLGFISVSTCVPVSGRSAGAVRDYAALANKILDETPLVDG